MLQPRRDVDAVAEHVAVLFDQFAQIDGHAERDPVGLRLAALEFRDPALHTPCALEGLRARCRDLAKKSIAGVLHDAFSRCGHGRVDGLAAQCRKTLVDAVLVGFHQAHIAGHVGDQNRRNRRPLRRTIVSYAGETPLRMPNSLTAPTQANRGCLKTLVPESQSSSAAIQARCAANHW